jgi:hypothetical protein
MESENPDDASPENKKSPPPTISAKPENATQSGSAGSDGPVPLKEGRKAQRESQDTWEQGQGATVSIASAREGRLKSLEARFANWLRQKEESGLEELEETLETSLQRFQDLGSVKSRLEQVQQLTATSLAAVDVEKSPSGAGVDGKDPKKVDGNDESKRQGPRLKATPRINRISVEEYESRTFAVDCEHFTVDAIMAKDWETSPQFDINQMTNFPVTAEVEDFRRRLLVGEPVRFIQINSPALVALLDGVVEDPDRTSSETGDIDQPIVLLAPFNGLITLESHMDEYLESLERKWGEVSTSSEHHQRQKG